MLKGKLLKKSPEEILFCLFHTKNKNKKGVALDKQEKFISIHSILNPLWFSSTYTYNAFTAVFWLYNTPENILDGRILIGNALGFPKLQTVL